LFKEEEERDARRNGRKVTEDQITKKWNGDVRIQEQYKRHIAVIQSELGKLKHDELAMLNYKRKPPRGLEGCGNLFYDGNVTVFEHVNVRNGTASFLQSVQIFGTNADDQKETFLEKYKIFKAEIGIRVPPCQVGGTAVDLFELYKQVVLRGGLAEVLRKDAFLNIGRYLQLRGTEETLLYSLRVIYFKYLYEFEQAHQNNSAQRVGKIRWRADTIGQAVIKPKLREKVESEGSGLRVDEYGVSFVKAAAGAVASRDPQKMTWALNRLLFASYQTHNHEILHIDHCPDLITDLLGLIGVPDKSSQIGAIIPLVNEYDESAEVRGMCVDFLAPEPTMRRNFAQAALQVLVNLSQTTKNQKAYIINKNVPLLLKKIVDSENICFQAGCMKILKSISWKWPLKPLMMVDLIQALQTGLSMFSFEDQHSDMPALAEATLQLLSGLSANLCNRALLVKSLTKGIMQQASHFILSTDLNIRLAALECMCHLSEMGHGVPRRLCIVTNTLDYVCLIIKDAARHPKIQRACGYLGHLLLSEISKDSNLSKRFAHAFSKLSAVAFNQKVIGDYMGVALSSVEERTAPMVSG